MFIRFLATESESVKSLKDLIDKTATSHGPQLSWISQVVSDWIKQFPFVGILVLLMLLDVLTGYIAAAVHRDVDSSVSFRGALKKAQMLLMVAAGMVFELLYPDVPWGRIIAGLLCLGEMASIIENADKAGIPIPAQLKETMRRLRSAEKEAAHKADAKVEIEIKTDSKIYPIPGPQGPPGPKGDKGDNAAEPKKSDANEEDSKH